MTMAKKKKKREVLIVASKVKDYIKSKGLQSSGEVVPALSEKIYEMIDEAAERTKDNKRATMRPYDL
jgi:hypothetical protein